MDHVPVRVSTLRGDQPISFDVYIQIASKFILYLRQGDHFEGTRLSKLKEKKLRKMFIRPDDEGLYRDYISANIERAYSAKSDQTVEACAEIVQGLQQAAAEQVFENPGDQQSYAEAKEGTGRLAELLLREAEATRALLQIENTDQSITQHGVTVATWAVGVAQKLGIKEPRDLQLLSLGALIHDIGHASSDLQINRPVGEFSKEELAKYREHPKVGAELLADKPHIDTQVLRIIAEHEETINGGGYPKGLNEKQMDPMSVIVGAANKLDRFITFERIKPQAAIKKMFMEQLGLYPLGHMNALKAIAVDNNLQ